MIPIENKISHRKATDEDLNENLAIIDGIVLSEPSEAPVLQLTQSREVIVNFVQRFQIYSFWISSNPFFNTLAKRILRPNSSFLTRSINVWTLLSILDGDLCAGITKFTRDEHIPNINTTQANKNCNRILSQFAIQFLASPGEVLFHLNFIRWIQQAVNCGLNRVGTKMGIHLRVRLHLMNSKPENFSIQCVLVEIFNDSIVSRSQKKLNTESNLESNNYAWNYLIKLFGFMISKALSGKVRIINHLNNKHTLNIPYYVYLDMRGMKRSLSPASSFKYLFQLNQIQCNIRIHKLFTVFDELLPAFETVRIIVHFLFKLNGGSRIYTEILLYSLVLFYFQIKGWAPPVKNLVEIKKELTNPEIYYDNLDYDVTFTPFETNLEIIQSDPRIKVTTHVPNMHILEILNDFCRFYSGEFDWEKNFFCLYNGCIFSKEIHGYVTDIDLEEHVVVVGNPIDSTRNLAKDLKNFDEFTKFINEIIRKNMFSRSNDLRPLKQFVKDHGYQITYRL